MTKWCPNCRKITTHIVYSKVNGNLKTMCKICGRKPEEK